MMASLLALDDRSGASAMESSLASYDQTGGWANDGDDAIDEAIARSLDPTYN